MAQSVSISNLSKPQASNRWWLKLVRQTGFYILLLLAWEGLAHANIWPSYLFAGPLEVGQSLWSSAQTGVLFTAILTSVTRLVIGYVI